MHASINAYYKPLKIQLEKNNNCLKSISIAIAEKRKMCT